MSAFTVQFGTWLSLVDRKLRTAGCSENTRDSYLSSLHAFLKYYNWPTTESATILLEDPEVSVADWLDYMAVIYKPATVAAKKAGIRFCFSAVDVSVAADYRTPLEQYEPSPGIPGGMDTIKKVFRETLELHDHRLSVAGSWFVAATGFMGMRVSETLNITLESFSDDFESVRVAGKGRKYRTIPVPVFAQARIAELLHRNDDLPPANGFDRKRAARYFAAAYRRQGIADVFPHMARATYATHVYDACKDIAAVAYLLGHESIETTKRYITTSHVDAVRVAFDVAP